MKPISNSNAIGSEKVFRWISYTLVFLMMACVVITFSVLIRNVFPDWHAGMIAALLLFIVLERLFTYPQLKRVTAFSSEWLLVLGTQWIVIILFSRLLLSYANGFDSLSRDLSLFARGYVVQFFTPEFVITLILAFVLWYLSAHFLELLDEIGLDMKLALQEDTVPIQRDAVPAHQRMVDLIFTIGVTLVILTALTRLNLRSMLNNSTGMPHVELSRFSGAEAGALLYFVFGLALISLSRLMSLQTHWNRQK